MGDITDPETRVRTPIFTALHKGGGIRRDGSGARRRLIGRSIARILATHAKQAGIKGVSGHTPRRSVARLMHEACWSDEKIQKARRWSSVDVMRAHVGLAREQEGAGALLEELGV